MIFLNILGVTERLWSFILVLEEKTSKEIPEPSRLEFLKEFSANNFALPEAECDTSGSLNTGGEFCKSFQFRIDVYILHCKYQVKPHYLHGF